MGFTRLDKVNVSFKNICLCLWWRKYNVKIILGTIGEEKRRRELEVTWWITRNQVIRNKIQGKEKKPNWREAKQRPGFSSQILQGGAGERAELSVGRKKGPSGLSNLAGPGKPSRKDLLSQSHISQRKCSSINLIHWTAEFNKIQQLPTKCQGCGTGEVLGPQQ